MGPQLALGQVDVEVDTPQRLDILEGNPHLLRSCRKTALGRCQNSAIVDSSCALMARMVASSEGDASAGALAWVDAGEAPGCEERIGCVAGWGLPSVGSPSGDAAKRNAPQLRHLTQRSECCRQRHVGTGQRQM